MESISARLAYFNEVENIASVSTVIKCYSYLRVWNIYFLSILYKMSFRTSVILSWLVKVNNEFDELIIRVEAMFENTIFL